MGQLRTVDALLQVVRTFGDESVLHDGPIDPAGDAEKVQLETIVSDLGIVERRLQRLDADLKRTRTGERGPLEAEVALFQRFQSELESGGAPARGRAERGAGPRRAGATSSSPPSPCCWCSTWARTS